MQVSGSFVRNFEFCAGFEEEVVVGGRPAALVASGGGYEGRELLYFLDKFLKFETKKRRHFGRCHKMASKLTTTF